MPYGQDPESQRKIESATLQSGSAVENEDKENVRRIMEVFGEEDFEHLFPLHDKLYTYEAFVVAAGLFPKFCGEDDPSLGLTSAEVCKRELATLFSHVIFETNGAEPDHHEYFRQGLKHIKDHHCGKYPKYPPFDGPAECNFHSHGWSAKTWPPYEHAQYYARGPLMMKWNYNYGRFADAVYPGYPKDKMNIMMNPENLESGILGFLSALWIYMTPRSPMPSMHEIATGFYKPNEHDELSQIFPAFGATTNVFNGNKECNVEFGTESDSAYHRAQIYLDLLNFFNLHPEYHLGCSKMGPFPEEGSASHAQYFTKGVKANSCDLVTFPTAYSLYNRNDYKRCVCDSWFMDDGDCAMGTPGDKEQLPTTDDGKTKDEKSHGQQKKDKDADDKSTDKTADADKKSKSADDEKTQDDDEHKETSESTDSPTLTQTGRSTKTKADVHQPDASQRMAIRKTKDADTPKPSGASATAGFSAIALGALAVFVAN